MEAILAVVGVLLLTVQTHINYLMIQAAKNNRPNVTVLPPEVHVTQPDVKMEIDYQALAEAMANLPAPIVNVNVDNPWPVIPNPAPMPQYPSPYWQTPIVSETGGNINTYDDGHTITVNEEQPTNILEINGIPVRRFPSR